MSQVLPVNQTTYNAVKIRIDNPQAYVPKGIKGGNSEYNAVDIELKEPELKPAVKPVYIYPEAQEVVTYDQAGINRIDVPSLPAVYGTGSEKKGGKIVVTTVPEPNVTNTEREKSLNFHGLNFKAAKPEVMKAADMKPVADEKSVLSALESPDYDVQAKQMEEIVAGVLKDKNNAVPYITTSVFSALINLLEKDTTGLEGPDEAQVELRKKIIINEIIREQQLAENKKPEEIQLPFVLTDSDYAKASELNPLEMAERNKEYAAYTIATLAKVYAEDFEKQTGNVVPLTDLPGVSNIVEALRRSDNPSLKVTALETLLYINREEYKDEIRAIFEIAATDKNKIVAQNAAAGLMFMEGKLN